MNENGEELKSGRFVQHAPAEQRLQQKPEYFAQNPPAGPDIPSMVQAQSALLAQFGAVLGR